MRNPCSILLLGVLLGFGAVFVIPAEDIAETAYDESEMLPLVRISTFSLVVADPCAAAPVVRTRGASRRIGSLRGTTTQRLGHWISWPALVDETLTILDHSLRC